MLKCEAKMVDDKQDVKITIDDGSSTVEIMTLLTAVCCTVLEKLKPSFNFSVEDTIKGFANLIISGLNEKGDKEDEHDK